MSLKLYINGQLVDLEAGQVIAQTKQVNDLNSIDNRDANFTNTFKLPKTANNIRIMDFMSLVGNTSRVPYKKNICSLYSYTGECFIYNGWAVIKDAGKNYEVVVIDGIIDLYKKIENMNLSDLSLDELVHNKTVSNVIGSWSEERPYRYILADYNGDTGNVNPEAGVLPEVNIDFLVPSVKVSWLWQKIQEKFQVSFVGDVFDSFNFQELWMTYPKGLSISGENDHPVFKSNDYDFVTPGTSHWSAKWNSSFINELASDFQQIHMQVQTSGTYKIKFKGTFYGYRGANLESPQRNAKVRLGKNAQNASSNNNLGTPTFMVLADNISHGQEFTYNGDETFYLEGLDTICVIITGASDSNFAFNLLNVGNQSTLELELVRVDPNVIDFSKAFTDFPIKDFMNEIVHRFGLTMFKDKYSQSYTFLTLKEQLLNAPTVDWSDKLSVIEDENYIYGSYARRNFFRYNYNDKESSHNDWYIDVDNVNLQDSKDVIKSKIYSPERIQTKYLNEGVNVYKLWDKEIVENPSEGEAPVKYNPLDKRYYLLRSVVRDKNIKVVSKDLAGMDTISSFYYRENYYKLPFYDILQEYYLSLKQILNNTIIVNVQLFLKDSDIINFDFKKLYYFKQLGNYFLVNKINNFIPGRLTKCELVRVLFEELADPPQSIKITKVVTASRVATITFELAISVPNLLFEYRRTTSSVWLSEIVSEANNPYPHQFSAGPLGIPVDYLIRFKAGANYSNEVQISIPSSGAIIP